MSFHDKPYVPLEGSLFSILSEKIERLEAERHSLYIELQKLKEEKYCANSICKEPEIIDISKMSRNLKLQAYCSLETHDNRKHVICRILNEDSTSFAYYLDEEVLEQGSLETLFTMICILHKNLLNEIIKKYSEKLR